MEEDDAMGFDGDISNDGTLLEKRGNPRTIKSDYLNWFEANRSPSRQNFIRIAIKNTGSIIWWGVSSLCESTEIERRVNSDESTVPAALDTEHPIDVSHLLNRLPAPKSMTGLTFA